MMNSYLVANHISTKTLGSVYAASIESAQDIARALWVNDKDSLVLFDLRKEFDDAQSGKPYLM